MKVWYTCMFSFDFDHFRTRYTELIRFIIIQAFIILQFKLNKYGLFIYVFMCIIFIQKKMKIYEFCYDIEKLASVFFSCSNLHYKRFIRTNGHWAFLNIEFKFDYNIYQLLIIALSLSSVCNCLEGNQYICWINLLSNVYLDISYSLKCHSYCS